MSAGPRHFAVLFKADQISQVRNLYRRCSSQSAGGSTNSKMKQRQVRGQGLGEHGRHDIRSERSQVDHSAKTVDGSLRPVTAGQALLVGFLKLSLVATLRRKHHRCDRITSTLVLPLKSLG